MKSPSPVRLRATDAVFFLAAAGAAATGAAYFHGRGTMSGVVGCGLAALMMGFAPFLLAGQSNCPECGQALNGLPLVGGLKAYVRCVHCRRYAAWESGGLAPLGREHLAPRPEFALPADALKRLPQSCCVCLAPSCRVEDLVYSAAVRTPGLPTGRSLKFRVKAPYCARHFGEAALGFEDLSAFPGISLRMLLEHEPPDHHFVLKVRSYAFYLAAAGLS